MITRIRIFPTFLLFYTWQYRPSAFTIKGGTMKCEESVKKCYFSVYFAHFGTSVVIIILARYWLSSVIWKKYFFCFWLILFGKYFR